MESLQVRQKKIITLIGRIINPIVVLKTTYWKHGCLVKVVGDPKTDSSPLFTSVGKLVSGVKGYPTVLRGFRGYVKISCVGYSEGHLKKKMAPFLQENSLGTKTTDGYGRIIWESCEIKDYSRNSPMITISLSEKCPQCKSETVIYDKISKRKHCTTCNQTYQYKKFKIRKGLGTNYPKELQRLLIVCMLHDFVHTERHLSKIYQEVQIEDEEIRDACKNHHNGEENTNLFLPILQYYDKLASSISRKKRFKTTSRYNWEKGEIDFKLLKQDLEQVQHSPDKLYDYIYHSKELERIVESMEYGTTSLRSHLLLMVNLAINDSYSKRLKITKGNISLSASKREELDTAMDVEMHSITDHDIANSERAITSKTRRLEA